MRFKLDENFGTRTEELFRDKGHDVATARSQALHGCPDQDLYEICCDERSCLVTLDLDFADVTQFPPSRANGIVVLRVFRNPSIELLERLVGEFLQAVGETSLEGRLWIVEIGRFRIHEAEMEEDLS